MKLLTDFILVTGIIVLLIMLFSLWKSKQKKLPDSLLIFFFSLLLFRILQYYGLLHQIKVIHVLGFTLNEPIGFLAGPVLFLYVKSLYLNNENFIRKHIFHFIPFLIYFIFITIPRAISLTIDDYIFQYIYVFENSNLIIIEGLLEGIYIFIYVFVSLMILNRNIVKQNLHFFNKKKLTWIKYLLIGVLFLISTDITVSIHKLFFGKTEWVFGYFTILLLVGLIIYLGYIGMLQSRTLLSNSVNQQKKAKIKSSTNLRFSEAESKEFNELKIQLLQIMDTKKPYLNEDLNLDELAEFLSISNKKLSTLLNQYMDTSFYDFINHYRVEHFKLKLTDPNFENYTLLALAYDSGFKSKTSFNRIFKKSTGISPSQYKKKAYEIRLG